MSSTTNTADLFNDAEHHGTNATQATVETLNLERLSVSSDNQEEEQLQLADSPTSQEMTVEEQLAAVKEQLNAVQLRKEMYKQKVSETNRMLAKASERIKFLTENQILPRTVVPQVQPDTISAMEVDPQRLNYRYSDKKLEKWVKEKLKPYGNVTQHIREVDEIIHQHGGRVRPSAQTNYLLNTFDKTLRGVVEGFWEGNLDEIPYDWVKEITVKRFNSRGIVKTDDEDIEDRLQFHANVDDTLLSHIARINVERNDFLKTAGNTVENRKRVDDLSINLLKHHSGVIIKEKLIQLKRKWKNDELNMEFPTSEWLSLTSYFMEFDPLEGKTIGGHAAKNQQKQELKPCKYGMDCKRRESCRFKHSVPDSKRKRNDVSVENKAYKKFKARPKVEECSKCKHRHPVDLGCDKCWSCNPNLKPSGSRGFLPKATRP